MKKHFLFLAIALLVPSYAWAQHTFNMTWNLGVIAADKSDAPTGVKVQRKQGTAGTFAEIAKIGVVTSYADTLANPAPGGVQYCYRVISFNTAGDSPPSNEGCGTTAVIMVPPKAPFGFSTSAISSSTIELSWAAAEDSKGYNWERRKGNQPKIIEQTGMIFGIETSYRDSGLARGRTYCYDVSAFNDGGTGPFTDLSCATTRK